MTTGFRVQNSLAASLMDEQGIRQAVNQLITNRAFGTNAGTGMALTTTPTALAGSATSFSLARTASVLLICNLALGGWSGAPANAFLLPRIQGQAAIPGSYSADGSDTTYTMLWFRTFESLAAGGYTADVQAWTDLGGGMSFSFYPGNIEIWSWGA